MSSNLLLFSSLHMYNTSLSDPLALPEKIRFRGSKLDPMDVKVFEPTRQIAMEGAPCADDASNPCSHLCLTSSMGGGGFTCACNTGILLADNTTCRDEFTAVLLLAKRDDVRKISLDTPDFTDLVIEMECDAGSGGATVKSSIAVGFDPVERLVYWTDQFSGIHSSRLDGKEVKDVIVTEVRISL